MPSFDPAYRPFMTQAGLPPTHPVQAVDEFGDTRDGRIAEEFPLTIKVDEREVVTLMTLGTYPELLTLGYLRNQRLFEQLSDIRAVEVDWDHDRVAVSTRDGQGIRDWEHKLAKRTVTTGCGQGTVFSCTLDRLYDVRFPPRTLRQSALYGLLEAITDYNEIYRAAGGVHGCALCQDTDIHIFIEDVGRHNAADAISGRMWLEDIPGADKIFYTTGRLTSEIVMKTAHMGIPVLLSRSGVTYMGLELARELGMTMIARAKGRHFLIYNGGEQVIFDATPERRPVTGRLGAE